ncbi:MAG TPA: hypothetical protein VI320_28055 [Terracidiphilus sp.]
MQHRETTIPHRSVLSDGEFIKLDMDELSIAFLRVSLSGGIYQNLAHGARRDGFEVRQRGCGQMGRDLEFHPRFNLLLNKGQVAFHADRTQDGTIPDFSFVAGSGAPIENPFHRTLPGSER